MNENITILEEKYRPQTLEDIILPDSILNLVKGFLEKGIIPHLGLFGHGSGTGKTSLNKVIVNELKANNLSINASIDKGIDLARDTLTSFCSSISLEDNLKIISMSECDGMSDALQRAIRDLIDSNSDTCRFIFTANFTKDIIDPILKRLCIINFDKEFSENKKEIAVKMLKRLKHICSIENIKYEDKDLQGIIKSCYPSFRQMLITLQKFSSNSDNTLILPKEFKDSLNLNIEILELIKNKSFTKARTLVRNINNTSDFYLFLYNNCEVIFGKENNLIDAILILNHFYQSESNCRDKEINLCACIAQMIKSNLTIYNLEELKK